jgi:hypothetical protein
VVPPRTDGVMAWWGIEPESVRIGLVRGVDRFPIDGACVAGLDCVDCLCGGVSGSNEPPLSASTSSSESSNRLLPSGTESASGWRCPSSSSVPCAVSAVVDGVPTLRAAAKRSLRDALVGEATGDTGEAALTDVPRRPFRESETVVVVVVMPL